MEESRAADLQEFIAIEKQKTSYRRKQVMLRNRSATLANLEALAAMHQPDSKMKSKIEKKKACIASMKKESFSLYEEVARRMDALSAKANDAQKPQANKALKRSQDAMLEVELAKKQLCLDCSNLRRQGAESVKQHFYNIVLLYCCVAKRHQFAQFDLSN